MPKVYGNRLRLSTLTVLVSGLVAGVAGVILVLPLLHHIRFSSASGCNLTWNGTLSRSMTGLMQENTRKNSNEGTGTGYL